MKPSRSIENVSVHPQESVDAFLEGRLRLIQSRTGYRFSLDAILLSEFVTVRPDDIILDLGTGCGIIPLLILKQKTIRYAVGLEIQDELADQAGRNARLNGFSRQMAVMRGDIRNCPLSSKSMDVVICNPPYRKRNNGRINPDPQKAVARHELLTTINDILAAAREVLKPKGRMAVIYPTERLADILIRMRGFELEPKRMRLVYPHLESEAKLVLIEALLRGRPGLKVLPPLLDQGQPSTRPGEE